MRLKALLLLPALLAALPSLAQDAFYYTYEGQTIFYSVIDEAAKTVAACGHGEMNGDLILPEHPKWETTEYTLTEIGDWALYNCSSLTSVTIPNSVTSIGEAAFLDCSGLTAVTIGNSVTKIGYRAFEGCSGLTHVNIPNSVTEISHYGFRYCSGLTEVTIGNSVTSIGSGAFEYCSSLTSVTIPNSVTEIDWYAFSGCSGLTAVTIGNSVTSIGQGAFNGCSGLKSVTIPNSVTSIGQSAFHGCSGLTEVTIGNSVTSISGWAFYGCEGLISVTIPNSVTSIGQSAFSGCSGLTEVTIGNSVTEIGNGAFSDCSSLETVYFNAESCTECGYSYDSKAFPSTIKTVSIGDNVKIIPAYIFYGCRYLTSVTIPSSVTSIGEAAFLDCSGLTSVTIPNSVTSIGRYAFSGCSGLNEMTIGNSVTAIGNYAFADCSGLTEVTIPNSVTEIREYAFRNCSGLTSMIIPNSVTAIGWDAFDGCSGLIKSAYPYNLSNPFDYNGISIAYEPEGAIIEDGCIYGAEKKEIFFAPLTLEGDFTIPESVTSIGDYAFYECSGLTKVSIGNSVNTIGDRAFYDCSGLTEVTIGNSVTSIGNHAFEACDRLTSVTIPNSVISIGYYAFYGCSGLNFVTIPNSVISIGVAAFSNCSILTEVTIPESVTEIGEYTFSSCSSLTEVTIPNSVTSIGEGAFSECRGLTSVTIPNSVTSISGWAFYNCNGLTSVKLGESLEEIGDAAFAGCNSISEVEYQSTSPAFAYETIFEINIYRDATLYVPEGSIKVFEKTTPWKNFYNIVEKKSSEAVAVSSLSFKQSSYAAEVGATLDLANEVVILPADATDKSLTWKSSDESIATVSDGVVTVLAEGTCEISATTADGSDLTATCTINASNPAVAVSSLSFKQSSYDAEVGKTLDLTNEVVILPEDATVKSLTWESADESVATVSNGVVTVLAEGTCEITTTTADGSDLTATCTIVASNPAVAVSSLSFKQSSYDAEVGTTLDLTNEVVIKPEDATDKSLTWKSSDESVATVSNGVVTVLAEGTCEITATTNDGSNLTAKCTINAAAGIEAIMAADEPCDVYTTSGILIMRDVTLKDITLAPGIYIVRQGGTARKIAVK